MRRDQYYFLFFVLFFIILTVFVLFAPVSTHQGLNGLLWHDEFTVIEYYPGSETTMKNEHAVPLRFYRYPSVLGTEYRVEVIANSGEQKSTGILPGYDASLKVRDMFQQWRQPELKGIYDTSNTKAMEKVDIPSADKIILYRKFPASGSECAWCRLIPGMDTNPIKVLFGTKTSMNGRFMITDRSGFENDVFIIPDHLFSRFVPEITFYRERSVIRIPEKENITYVRIETKTKRQKKDDVYQIYISQDRSYTKQSGKKTVYKNENGNLLNEASAHMTLDGIKRIRIKHFHDEPAMLHFNTEALWENKPQSSSILHIQFSGGSSVGLEIRKPPVEIHAAGDNLVLIKLDHSSDIYYIQESIYNTITGNLQKTFANKLQRAEK